MAKLIDKFKESKDGDMLGVVNELATVFSTSYRQISIALKRLTRGTDEQIFVRFTKLGKSKTEKIKESLQSILTGSADMLSILNEKPKSIEEIQAMIDKIPEITKSESEKKEVVEEPITTQDTQDKDTSVESGDEPARTRKRK